ncbi:MAG: class I SAM-dependent methyltransferase [Propionibacterium sp.]|nr:class I SAM-dependent methyltransferase [Propionibacterium sp.]
MQLRPEDELLDAGCGSGAFLAQEAQQVRRVAGVDLPDVQIDLARRRLAQRIADGNAGDLSREMQILEADNCRTARPSDAERSSRQIHPPGSAEVCSPPNDYAQAMQVINIRSFTLVNAMWSRASTPLSRTKSASD